MAVMLAQNDNQQMGYSQAVDWWSLGVCVYQMLVGKPPFVSEEESDKSAAKTFLKDYNMASKYAVLFTDVDYTEIMEDVVAVDFVSKLLEIDDRIRLGSGVEGFFDITSHNFFEGIDWAKLDDKEVEPPFIPEKVEKVVGEDEKGCTFEECLSKIHKKDFLKASKNLIRIQKYFNSYNYTSPDVIVEENKARKKS